VTVRCGGRNYHAPHHIHQQPQSLGTNWYTLASVIHIFKSRWILELERRENASEFNTLIQIRKWSPPHLTAFFSWISDEIAFRRFKGAHQTKAVPSPLDPTLFDTLPSEMEQMLLYAYLPGCCNVACRVSSTHLWRMPLVGTSANGVSRCYSSFCGPMFTGSGIPIQLPRSTGTMSFACPAINPFRLPAQARSPSLENSKRFPIRRPFQMIGL